MKKTLLLLFLLTLALVPASAKKSPAEKAAGTYSGLLYIGMNTPVTEGAEGQSANIKLEVETENTVKFTLPNFSYGSMNLGDIVLTGIPVSEDEQGRIVFGQNDPQTLKISIITASVNIDEKTSYIEGSEANIDVFVSTTVVFSPVNIYVRFKGTNNDYVADGIAQQMEGTRTGKTYSEYENPVTAASANSASSLNVEAVDAQNVNMVLSGVSVSGVEVGDLTFSNVSVTANSDGTVTLGNGTATGTIMGSMDYTMTLNGSKSYWSTDSVALDITADVAGMPFNLIFTTGTLVAEEETSEVTTGPAAEMAGTYNAGIYVSLGTPVTDETQKFMDADILIEAQTETTVRFTLKDFSLDGNTSLGDIVLEGIPVQKNEDGTFSFGANDYQDVSLGGGAIQAQARIDENTSYVDGTNLYIDVPVQAVGQTIYVHVGIPVSTGIHTISIDTKNQPVYNLKGQRVKGAAASGVYVIGGKKVYVK